jgi:hypothetical protein
MIIKIIFEKSLKIPRLGSRSRCLALVIQSQDCILQLRSMKMSWNVIARHLGISTSSLRNALNQINALTPDKFDKSKTSVPKLTLYFSDETEKKKFFQFVRTFSDLRGKIDNA